MKKLILFSILCMFLITSVSALDWDNKEIFDISIEDYGRYEIYDSWFLGIGYGDLLIDLTLHENTESCSLDCRATQTINLYEEGSLIDDVRFYRVIDGSNADLINIDEFNIYIKNRIEDKLVEDYDFVPIKKLINGTIIYEYKNIGSHDEPNYELIKYNIGDIKSIGTYEIELQGKKSNKIIVDWQIKSQGIWTENWAVWGISNFLDNLMIYYKEDEAAGATGIIIDSQNNFSGVNNNAINVSGLINSSYSFDGVNDYINTTFNTTIQLAQNFSIQAWIRTTDSGTKVFYGSAFTGGGLAEMRLNTNEQAEWFMRDENALSCTAIGTTNISDNLWHHLIIVRDTSLDKCLLYVDGVNEVNGTDNANTVMNLRNIWIGGRNDQASALFQPINASIDEWAFWNRTLTQAEITQLNNGGNGFQYPFVDGIITLLSPEDNFNTSNVKVNFTFNAVLIGGSTIVNGSLLTNESGTWTEVNTTIGLSGTSETLSFNRTFADGTYLWSASFCDSDGDCGFALENRTLSVDATFPTIEVESPNVSLIFEEVGLTIPLNITFTDSNLDKCWYNYNGTNISIDGCVSGVKNSTTFVLEANNSNLTVYANDTAGNLGFKFVNWSYIVEKFILTYDTNETEGEASTFSAEVIISSGGIITEAILIYNGTNYTSSIIFSGGEYLISSTINVPLVSEHTNFSFGFQIVAEGESYIPLLNNQTVLNLDISQCGGISNDTLINMSLLDEVLRTILFGDLQINFNIISKSSGEIVSEIDEGFNNVSYAAICFSPPESYPLYYLDAEIRYTSSGYVSEFYIIQKADLTDYPINLSLFDLNSSSSTEFLIKYQDDGLITVEGAVVQLLRKYIQNDTFETVEAPLTSNIGTAVVHVDLDTNKYQAIVVKEGVILDVFTNLVFNCENELSGQCTQNLFGAIDPRNAITIEVLNDFTYLVTEVNNTITTTFSIPSGTPEIINIQLKQVDTFGNESLCNQTIVSSAGSIDCTYNDTIGDSMVFLEISKAGIKEAEQSYFIEESGGVDWLDNNFFIVLILLLSIVGMGVSSPEWMVINGVVTIVISGGLWLINGFNFVIGLGGLIWLIVAAGILIFKLTKQEDR